MDRHEATLGDSGTPVRQEDVQTSPGHVQKGIEFGVLLCLRTTGQISSKSRFDRSYWPYTGEDGPHHDVSIPGGVRRSIFLSVVFIVPGRDTADGRKVENQAAAC